MEKIRISTDSTADIPESYCQELGIAVLPLSLLSEGKEYRDGVDITPREFYRLLETAKEIPTSAQIPAANYLEFFEETWKAGYTHLIHTAINSKGSGTYQAGVMAREMFFEEHPEAKGALDITLIDSKTYSMTYGLAVINAAKLVKEGGKSAGEITAFIREWVDHGRPLFVPLTLKWVKKSGRISPAAAFLGEALGLKPVITFEKGDAAILSKARGEAGAYNALIERCQKERKPGSDYAIVFGSNPQALEKMRALCAEKLDQPPLCEYNVGCVIGINTGPNMIGLIYRT